MKIDDNSAKVSFPPPLVYIGFLLVGLVIDRILGLTGFGLPMAFRVACAAFFAFTGIALIVAGVGRFRSAGTPPEPWREVTALVTTGVYRFTRNPMYLGMAAIHIGIAFGMDSISALVLLAVVIIVIRTQVIAREEVYMARTFGATYSDYCKRVRRWF